MTVLRTCYTDAVDVIGHNSLIRNDLVQLRTSPVEHDGVEAHTVEEAQAQSKLVQLIKHSSSDLNDGELGGMRGMRGRGKNAEIALNLLLGSDRVKQPSNGVLRMQRHGETISSSRPYFISTWSVCPPVWIPRDAIWMGFRAARRWPATNVAATRDLAVSTVRRRRECMVRIPCPNSWHESEDKSE